MKKPLHKVGIIGGSFDPVHNGHLMIAENALEQFGLEKVLFLPNGNPPHKDKGGMTPAAIRCQMVEMAIEGNPGFSVSYYEAEAEKTCYSWETLQSFCQAHPHTEFYIIMGEDSLFHFSEWMHPERIAAMCVILVAVREEGQFGKLSDQIEKMEGLYHADIRTILVPEYNVSSRMIRERVSKGQSIRYLVPDPVRLFIGEHHLYE